MRLGNIRLRRKKKIPTINLELETRVVKAEVRSFKVDLPPYEFPTDKELLEGLWESEQFEAASRIEELKKENAVLKGKLTKLTNKHDALKEQLNDWHD